MGLRAKFKSDDVSRILERRGKRANLALRNRLESAAKEFYSVTRMLAPYKTGTLQKAVRITRNDADSWSIWINEDQKVPQKRSQSHKKPVHVRDYLLMIETGQFSQIGKRSREKEAFTDKRKLAGFGVRRSPQGSYVGGIFFGRTLDALELKWNKRFEKAFVSAMERGLM